MEFLNAFYMFLWMWELRSFWNSLIFFVVSNNFRNALIRKKNLYAHVWGILPSPYVRWFEVDESRLVWLSHKRQVHLLNLVVAIFKEQVPTLKCSYVASSLFFVIFSPFEFIRAWFKTQSKIWRIQKYFMP